MRLDAFLPQSPPWCPFNQARSRGSLDPSELDLAEIARTSRCSASPPAIRHALPTPLIDNVDNGCRHAIPLYKGADDSDVASGAHALCRLGPPRWIFSALRRPGSPGFCLPGAFPFRAPVCFKVEHDAHGLAARPSRYDKHNHKGPVVLIGIRHRL
jgi:hypothetical protein